MKLNSNKIILLLLLFLSECNTIKKDKPANPEKVTGYIFKNASADGTGKFYLGREISQVMGSGGAAWLERNERQHEENVKLAIDKMNLLPGNVVADIGAGTGYYSFKIAERVSNGKVYAVEIQDDFIRYLNSKKKDLNIKNVEVIKGSVRSPNLPTNSIDLAMMADVYHELEYPCEMLQAIRKSLKPAGKILLLEYRGEDPSIPIKPLHKTTVSQLNRELGANGFKLSYDGEFLPIQHFLIYEKN